MSDIPPKPLSKQPLPETATKVFSGKLFDVYQWEQPQYDGTVKTFEKLKRSDTVLVIPITPEGEIILAEEEQPGKQPFLGFLGGRIEEGEDPLTAAKRELLEETGFEAEEFILFESIQPISKIEWAVYSYIARGCRKVTEQHLDSGEKIELKPLSFEEAVKIMASDEFPDREVMLVRKALQASYDPVKKEELKKLLLG